MGNELSTLSESGSPRADSDARTLDSASCGFRVLGIQEQSPASRAGFVSFFDFILEANSIRLDTKDSTFMELIAQSEDVPMQLTVYNVKAQTTRTLELTPSRAWPGKGLLGVTIRFDSFDGAQDDLLHVLNVVEGSPAHSAGVRPASDYLLGTPERVFRDPEDLADELLDARNDSFQCYVYNTELDQVRIVTIAPREQSSSSSDDSGVLGAEVAHGMLHRLPTTSRQTIGTSIGFVHLAIDATAATDAFLRRDRPASASFSRPSNEHIDASNSTDSTREGTDKTQVVATNAADAATITNNDAGDEATDADVATTTNNDVEDADATFNKPADAAAAVAVDPLAAPQAPPLALKPRYTARTDLRFPLSTVEVFADPTQLS